MASANKIPLKCDICPKKPRFSDVSHLLTHISSKTHLSNIFKARVRLEIDTESRRLVEDYDQWYAEWSIQDLLAERLSQKDSKMPKPRSRAPAKAGKGGGGRTGLKHSGTPPAGIQSVEGAHVLGPELNPIPVNGQGGLGMGAFPYRMVPMTAGAAIRSSVGGTFERIDPSLNPQAVFNGAAVPTLQHPSMFGGHATTPHYNTFTYGSLPSLSVIPPREFHQVIREQEDIDHPTGKRKAAVEAFERIKRDLRCGTGETESLTQFTDTIDTPPSDDWSLISATQSDVVWSGSQHRVLPNCRVKGKVYPGMGAFDSATDDNKRKRNQKKDESAYLVLYQLSEYMSDNRDWEVIYQPPGVTDPDDACWVPFKARPITGHPTPSSLATSPASSRDSSPVRKKQALRTRKRAGTQASTTRDDRTENQLDFPELSQRLGVYRDTNEAVHAADPFTDQAEPSRFANLVSRGRVNTNQENESIASMSAHDTTNTDAEATDGASFVMPSTERFNELPNFNLNLGVPHAGPSAQSIMLPPPTPHMQHPLSQFGHSSPSRYISYGAPASAYFAGSLAHTGSPIRQNGYISGPDLFHAFPPAHHPHRPIHSSPSYQAGYNLQWHSPSAPSYNYGGYNGMNGLNNGIGSGMHNVISGMNTGTTLNMASERLNNLAQVASQDLASEWMAGDGANDPVVDDDRTVTAPGSDCAAPAA